MRNQFRKVVHGVSKQDNSVDESFEDLLFKHRQIQLELECIRKEETMALEPKESPSIDQISPHPVPDNTSDQAAVPGLEEPLQEGGMEKKVFQAFNIRPLRQRLPISLHLDENCADQDNDQMAGERTQTCCSCLNDKKVAVNLTFWRFLFPVGEECKDKEGTDADDADNKGLVEKKTCPLCSEGDNKTEKSTKPCSCRSDSSASSEDSAVSSDKVRLILLPAVMSQV